MVKSLIETSGDALLDTLMRSGVIVAVDEPGNEAVQVGYVLCPKGCR